MAHTMDPATEYEGGTIGQDDQQDGGRERKGGSRYGKAAGESCGETRRKSARGQGQVRRQTDCEGFRHTGGQSCSGQSQVRAREGCGTGA